MSKNKDATVGGVGGIPAPQYQGAPERIFWVSRSIRMYHKSFGFLSKLRCTGVQWKREYIFVMLLCTGVLERQKEP